MKAFGAVDLSWLRPLAIFALLVCALTGCVSPPAGEPEMDKVAVTARIEELPGVVSAEIGALNTGVPGAFSARIAITVDGDGREAVGAVIDGAVRAVAADPGGYDDFQFEVTAPDGAVPGELVILTLSDYRDSIPFDEGAYLGSTLTLSASKLAAAASR